MGLPKDIDARKYARVAKQRLDEARLIHEKVGLWSAAQYLGGYAVECGLKALVLSLTPASERPAQGAQTIEWLKHEFGHDLTLLRRAAADRGARMPKAVAKEFVFVCTWDPQSRYEPGRGDPDEAGRFLSAAEAVLQWADGKM